MDKQKRTSKANDASYLKNWKRSNKEKVKTYQRKYRASHREENRVYMQKYRARKKQETLDKPSLVQQALDLACETFPSVEQTFYSEEGTLNLADEGNVSTNQPVTSCEKEVDRNIAELKTDLSFLADNNFFTLADEGIVSTNEPVASCEKEVDRNGSRFLSLPVFLFLPLYTGSGLVGFLFMVKAVITTYSWLGRFYKSSRSLT